MLCIDLLHIYIQPESRTCLNGLCLNPSCSQRAVLAPGAESDTLMGRMLIQLPLKKWEASGVIAVRNGGMIQSRAEAKRKDGKRNAVWMRQMAQDNEKGHFLCLLLPFLLARVSKTTKWNSALAARSVLLVSGFSRKVGYSFPSNWLWFITSKRKRRRPCWPS